jgi:hypothetical protein
VRLLAYAYAMTDDWTKLTALLEANGMLALGDGELEKFEHLAADLGRAREARRMGALRQPRA